jgi:LysR family transcriptional regulator, regulator for bpeEF and oprC
MDQFSDLAAFAAVAEMKAFASAARRLGVSTSGVSKSVNRLEDRLGVRLFTRTTRRVALTAEGENFYGRSREILDALMEAESELRDATSAIRGRIRIDMPLVFGERHVLPLLAQFRVENPDVFFDARLSDSISNLVEDNMDLAIRFGELSDIKAIPIGPSRLVTCATPAYLARFGTPKSVADLERHKCISFQLPETGRIYRWRFKGKSEDVIYLPPLQNSVNDISAYHRLALLDEGLIQDLQLNLIAEIAQRRLVEVLKSVSASAFPLAIVWPAGRHQTRRVRALIDFLRPALRSLMKS